MSSRPELSSSKASPLSSNSSPSCPAILSKLFGVCHIPACQNGGKEHSSRTFGHVITSKSDFGLVPCSTFRFCPEVYIGEQGHLIRTCCGYRRHAKHHIHEWINGRLSDILVPVETFHLDKMFQGVIRHNQRFDFDRVPAVLELCWQAGADPYDDSLNPSWNLESVGGGATGAEYLSPDDLRLVAIGTLKAWELVRSGVQKLLMVYPAKVCKYCGEVHVGPSGHKARLCGVFKFESWRGTHVWKKAEVDDLVPPKIVWYRRPQDPPVLLDEGREFYGHAPAVLDLCVKAGAVAPSKYFCMMKVQGLTAPVLS
ncbi:APO protein 4, mitochondrial isoform X2 [Camellia sinensis]|uniref:APO protein 4, mitochondrial isoform X2 n=1 Tax=Camellia sinensis TaxID=4442 RepID=UPI001036EB3A|nr:APO protein 4, mitochondrial isoform X2 [Camellia sinensis]